MTESSLFVETSVNGQQISNADISTTPQITLIEMQNTRNINDINTIYNDHDDHDIIDLNEIKNENDNKNEEEDEEYDDLREKEQRFYKFQQEVKSKRKATFCCIFSIGSFILSMILLLAPLSTQMIADWRLYNSSIHTQCKIINIYIYTDIDDQIDDEINIINYQNKTNLNNKQCLYQYERTDNQTFSNFCGSKMHETASCSFSFDDQYDIGYVGECCFYPNNNDKDKCQGTMINTLSLQRNNNIFVILLGIGTILSIITICTGIYGIYLINSSGIYCSIISTQKDDDNIFNLMETLQKEYDFDEKKSRKRKIQRRRRRNKESAISSSLQISSFTVTSSTTHSKSTINSTINSTMNSTLSGDEKVGID